MNTKFDFKNTLKVTLGVTLALSISFATANAAQTMAKLSGIEINPSQQTGGYNIVLNTDQNVTFEKTIKSNDNIEIDLKGAEVSKPLNTVYNNSTNIDHVLFKPTPDGNVQILLQGKNIAQSDIKIATNMLPSDVAKNATPENTVFLNRPINTYAPVVPQDNEDATDGVYNSMLSSFSLSNLLSKRNLGWLLSFVMLAIFLVSSIKRTKEKNSLNIKLSEDLKEKEISLYSQLNKKRDSIGIGLGSNKYEEERPVAVHKQAYGLKAYENSQINPQNRGLKTTSSLNSGRINPLANKTAVAPKRKPVGQRTATIATKKDVQTAQVQIDSMKFLESMAKIYEKSGRVDLANGLQDNILKAKYSK